VLGARGETSGVTEDYRQDGNFLWLTGINEGDAWILLAIGAVWAFATGKTDALTFNSDGALRSKDIHWPEGFHPEQANMFAHNEIDIHASCTKAFANLVDAETWPAWYPNSHNVKILTAGDGKLHDGSRFSWETFRSHTESEVHEFVPDQRLGWFGNGTGTRAS
jgi:hypothetical protein